MALLTKALVGAAAVAFVVAVVSALAGRGFFGITAEGFSRACSNLALLAIATVLVMKTKQS